MNKQIEREIKEFINEINYYQIYEFDNGFFGFGILKTPEDHIKKGINTILLRSYGIYNNDTIHKSRFVMTEKEAQCIMEGLGKVLEIFKKRKDEK